MILNTIDAWRAWYLSQGLSASSLAPVPEDKVLAAEKRLGVDFPPSYRSYLLSIGQFVLPIHWGEEEMLPIEEVTWFNGESSSNNTLQVSSFEGQVAFLLDAKSIGPDGEMKAWLYGDWIDGGKRSYNSFSELFTQCQIEVARQGEVEAAKF